jgi:disulfide bond formation protein DsbB
MKIKLLDSKVFFLSLFIISAVSLIFALFVENILGYLPCHLCIYQRWPYAVIGILSSASLFANHKYITIFIILAICSSIILSFWHAGIELNIFESASTCNNQIKLDSNLSFAEMIKALDAAPVATCSAVAFKIFNISMSQINFIISIILLIFSLIFYKKHF